MINLIGLFKSVQAKKARTNSHILKAGFTLVELAIVLVIIGLVVGGVLVGKDLIRASEIRSVISQEQQYISAYNTFKIKYNCIPGDCANATTLWGAENATPATCQTTASYGSLTCDGNGNGQVADGTYEMFRFWQHLALAGLIKGQYTGVAGAISNFQHILDVNAPSSAISGAGFGFSYKNDTIGGTWWYAVNCGNTFWFGKTSLTTGAQRPQYGVFTPAEAQAFDAKIDDGKPATGSVIATSLSTTTVYTWGNANACSTSTSQTDYTGVYNTASSVVVCGFLIKTGEY